jgi:hypothetical protein
MLIKDQQKCTGRQAGQAADGAGVLQTLMLATGSSVEARATVPLMPSAMMLSGQPSAPRAPHVCARVPGKEPTSALQSWMQHSGLTADVTALQ